MEVEPGMAYRKICTELGLQDQSGSSLKLDAKMLWDYWVQTETGGGQSGQKDSSNRCGSPQ